MAEVEEVLSLIGDIYDASLDPRQWPGVLRKAGGFVGGSAAALFSKDAARKSLDVYHDDGGIDPHYAQLYFSTYMKLDPSNMAHAFADIGQPVSTVDIMPFEEFYATRFYREWGRPQGWVDFVTTALDKSATGTAMLGVFRHERDGVVDDETRSRMRLIAPHVRRAVLIGRVIDFKTVEAATFADTLDGLSAGLFLVDCAGRIVHANASGHAMLSAGDALRCRAGRLAAMDTSAAPALTEAFASAECGDAAMGVRGIAVPLSARDGGLYMAHVLPLTAGARRGTGWRCTAAVFVHRAELETVSPPEAIAKLYGLAPSELRVLLAIVQVGGVPETAEALGIGEATVRTHLHRLFAKTGTRRQAELVKMVAGFSSPLLPRTGAPRLAGDQVPRRLSA